MPSPLSFASTTSFRNALIVKNLSPYSITGTYSPPSGAINYETTLTNFSVIDWDWFTRINYLFKS